MTTKHRPWNGECPHCKEPFAYLGFTSLECSNTQCVRFTAQQKQQVDEYIDYLDTLAKEKEEKSKLGNSIYYSNTCNKSDDEDKTEEELTYGTYAMYGTVPCDPKDQVMNDPYDTSGFYGGSSYDPADTQPIPVMSDDDDDLLDLMGPV